MRHSCNLLLVLYVLDFAAGQSPTTSPQACAGASLYSVTTVAGSLSGTVGITDGIGTNAFFNAPAYPTFAFGGARLYLGDQGGCKLRAINMTTYAVTTAAGNGSCNFGNVDGVGTAARFAGNGGLAWDAEKLLLYVGAYTGAVLRSFTPATGVVATLAGGPTVGHVDGVGTNAKFGDTRALALDAANRVLYATDWLSQYVRAINLTSMLVTTLAGTGGVGTVDGPATAALFNAPTGIAYDPLGGAGFGAVYVADTSSGRVRLIPLSSPGKATTVSSVVYTALAPRGVAIDRNFGLSALLWSSYNGGGASSVFRADLLNNFSTTIAAGNPTTVGRADGVGTNAQFTGIMGIGINDNGMQVAVVEFTGARVRLMTLICAASPSAASTASPTATASGTPPATPAPSSSQGASTTATATLTGTGSGTFSGTGSGSGTSSATTSDTPTSSLAASPPATTTSVPAASSPAAAVSSTGAASASSSASGSSIAVASPSGNSTGAGGGGGAGQLAPDASGGAAAVVGGVVGAIVVLAAAGALLFLTQRRRASRAAAAPLAKMPPALATTAATSAAAATAAEASFRHPAESLYPSVNPLAAAADATASGRAAAAPPRAPAVAAAGDGDAETEAKSGLLPGWTAVWSKSRATWYWRNASSGETSWQKPANAAASQQPTARLPPGWTETISRSQGKPFWRHVDGRTQWTRPA